MAGRGTLILVVGPSGVGKDSIIAGAAERLRDDPRIAFARRLITRQLSDGGKRHVPVSPAEFVKWREAGRSCCIDRRTVSITGCRRSWCQSSKQDAA